MGVRLDTSLVTLRMKSLGFQDQVDGEEAHCLWWLGSAVMAWVSCHMVAEGHRLGNEGPAHLGIGEKLARKVLVAKEGSGHKLNKSCCQTQGYRCQSQ